MDADTRAALEADLRRRFDEGDLDGMMTAAISGYGNELHVAPTFETNYFFFNVNQSFVLAIMKLAAVMHLPKVDRILQQLRERAAGERHPPDGAAVPGDDD